MKYKLPCSIVRDLLPSYIDKLTGKESDIAVKEHLESCAECRALYTAMSDNLQSNNISIDDAELLKKSKKKLRKERVKTVILAILITAVLTVTAAVLIAAIVNEVKIHFNTISSQTARKLEYYNAKAIADIDSLIGCDRDEAEKWVEKVFSDDNLTKEKSSYGGTVTYTNPEKNVQLLLVDSSLFIEPYNESSNLIILPLNSDYINSVNEYCADANADYKNPPVICELALYDFDKANSDTFLIYYYLINNDGSWGYHGDMQEQHNCASFVYDENNNIFIKN